MWEKSRQATVVGGFDACGRPRPPEEVLVVRHDGGMIKGRRVLRVLVADDNRDAADSLSMLVTLWGHHVRAVYDGTTALQMASAYRPEVLLLDLGMPNMDGCRLARQLRRQAGFKDALLIAVTGYSDSAHRRLGEEAGFDLFLIKPVDPSAMEKLLRHEQDRRADAPEAPRAAPRKYGILVVDDEGGVRGVLNVGLRKEGFAVWLAADGREALDLYRRYRELIDVVLLDVRMPGLDGPQTLAALQELNPQVRFCFMSGDLGSYTGEWLHNLGAATVLPKPFRLDEVARVLWQLASRADAGPVQPDAPAAPVAAALDRESGGRVGALAASSR
jgi:CheY-like chemotaxis protein